TSFPNGGTTTVTLGDSATNGTIRVTDAAPATSSRTFDIAQGGGTIDVVSATGTVSLTGPLTGSGKLTKSGLGSLTVTGAAGLTGPAEVSGGALVVTGNLANSSGMTVTGGKFDAASAQTVKALTVTGGQARVVSATKIALTVGDGTATASQLSLTGGKLDLMTNGLAVHYAAGAGSDAAALASVRSQILAGYHPTAPTAGDGKWDGATGITSSSIGSLTAVGYALAGDVLAFANGTSDTFLGTTVDKSTVIARYTLGGDVNLDGAVDFLDLARLAQSYNVTDGTRQWSTGDINYDGNTDFLDLAKMAQNYNTALPSSPVPGASADFQADLARAFAAVPEPGVLGVLGLSVLFLRRRTKAE
ncbi:MAG: hypothetical protein JWN40_2241, partial [Phycisphaerales bacterium]|nr:hypothetical protein [Phycisphaerales bacterium]